MHGSEVEAGVRRRSWFELAWQETLFGRLVRLGSGSPPPSHSSKGQSDFDFCPHKLVDSAGRNGASVWVRKFEEKHHVRAWRLLLEPSSCTGWMWDTCLYLILVEFLFFSWIFSRKKKSPLVKEISVPDRLQFSASNLTLDPTIKPKRASLQIGTSRLQMAWNILSVSPNVHPAHWCHHTSGLGPVYSLSWFVTIDPSPQLLVTPT